MNFEIWHGLESGDYESQQNDLELLLRTTVNVISSEIDGEGMFKAKVVINSLEELKELGYLLDGDIVIYGADSDVIMTAGTMKELGLG